MPPWIVKAAVQGVLARLPESQRWNHMLQRYVTGSLDLTDEVIEGKLRQLEKHVEHWRESGRSGKDLSGLRVLELGTGWFPMVPVGLVLLGADRVWTIDTQSLLEHGRVLKVLHAYAELCAAGRLEAKPGGLARLESALAQAPDLDADALLARMGIRPIVGDARATALERGTVDLFVSNNTFEHIPRPVLVEILQEFRRLAAPGALGSHWIDMGDHYKTFDASITVLNFYKYPSWMWRLFNNELQYQNRLRASDFRAIHDEVDWTVLHEEHKLAPLEDLRRLRLAREFRDRYDENELRICAAWFVSRAGPA